jgi:hypothetical protein
MKHVLVVLSFVTVVLASGVARADLTTRCANGRIASVGDRAWEVRGACGAPDQADRRVVYRELRQRVRSLVAAVTVPVTIDEWLYDDGPDRLLRIFTFEDGRLVRIDTRGFGSR